MMEATERVGFDFGIVQAWENQMTEAGFVDIHMRKFAWPLGPWAKGRKAKIMGEMALANALVYALTLVSRSTQY